MKDKLERECSKVHEHNEGQCRQGAKQQGSVKQAVATAAGALGKVDVALCRPRSTHSLRASTSGAAIQVAPGASAKYIIFLVCDFSECMSV